MCKTAVDSTRSNMSRLLLASASPGMLAANTEEVEEAERERASSLSSDDDERFARRPLSLFSFPSGDTIFF